MGSDIPKIPHISAANNTAAGIYKFPGRLIFVASPKAC